MKLSNLFTRFLLVTVFAVNQVPLVIAAGTDTDAAYWLSLTRSERSNYVLGFKMGAGKAYLKSTELWATSGYFKRKPSLNDLKRISTKVCPKAELTAIVEGVSKLYEDSSNTYVDLGEAIYITIERLKGTDVERQLRESRRIGFEFHQQDSGQK